MAKRRQRKAKKKGGVGLQPAFFRPKVSDNGASSIVTATTDLIVEGGSTADRNALKVIPIAPWSADIASLFNQNYHYVKLNWIELLVMPWCKSTDRGQFVSWIDDCSVSANVKSSDAGQGLATWAQARYRTRASTSEGTILRATPNSKWTTVTKDIPPAVTMENSFCEVGMLGLYSNDTASGVTIAKVGIRISLTYKDRKVLDKLSKWKGLPSPSQVVPLDSVHLSEHCFQKCGVYDREGGLAHGYPDVPEPVGTLGLARRFSTTITGQPIITNQVVTDLEAHVEHDLSDICKVRGVPTFTPGVYKFQGRAVPSITCDGANFVYTVGVKCESDVQITSVRSPRFIGVSMGSRGPDEWDTAKCFFPVTMTKDVWRMNPSTSVQVRLQTGPCEGNFLEPVDWLVYKDQVLVIVFKGVLRDPRPGVDLLTEVKANVGHALELPDVEFAGYTS